MGLWSRHCERYPVLILNPSPFSIITQRAWKSQRLTSPVSLIQRWSFCFSLTNRTTGKSAGRVYKWREVCEDTSFPVHPFLCRCGSWRLSSHLVSRRRDFVRALKMGKRKSRRSMGQWNATELPDQLWDHPAPCWIISILLGLSHHLWDFFFCCQNDCQLV